jgi:hypothetical protein
MLVSEEILNRVKQHFARAARRGDVRDLAFLGAASEIYRWRPCQNAEIDVCFLIDDFSERCGGALKDVSDSLCKELTDDGFDYDFRIVRGPYKRTSDDIARSCVVIHAAVFTEEGYKAEAPQLLKWSWRKYSCIVRESFFKECAPERPLIRELLHGKLGIDERIRNIQADNLVLAERSLPSLVWRPLEVPMCDNLFTEYCIAAAADTARNHGRVLGIAEADTMSNEEYFRFYAGKIFQSQEFRELMEIKRVVREQGYRGFGREAKRTAMAYLVALKNSLQSGV